MDSQKEPRREIQMKKKQQEKHFFHASTRLQQSQRE